MSERPDPLARPEGIGGRRAVAARLAVRANCADPLQRVMGCPPPVWMNRDDQKRPDGRCVHYVGWSGGRCQVRATHWVWIGCTVGEHLDKSGMCETHAEMVGWTVALHCLRCWDALGVISEARVVKIEVITDGDQGGSVHRDRQPSHSDRHPDRRL